MTIEELKEHCVRQITEFERIKEIMPVTPNGYKRYEEHKIVLQLIEAWEKVKKEVIAKKNFNAEVKDAFEVGSHSRIECNTTVAVLGEVLNLIDKHLSEVEK